MQFPYIGSRIVHTSDKPSFFFIKWCELKFLFRIEGLVGLAEPPTKLCPQPLRPANDLKSRLCRRWNGMHFIESIEFGHR
jgi:hypothetical protein